MTLAHNTATSNSTVIKIELKHAPTLGMPIEKSAVGIAVPNTVKPITQYKNATLKLKPPTICPPPTTNIAMLEPVIISALFNSKDRDVFVCPFATTYRA